MPTKRRVGPFLRLHSNFLSGDSRKLETTLKLPKVQVDESPTFPAELIQMFLNTDAAPSLEDPVTGDIFRINDLVLPSLHRVLLHDRRRSSSQGVVAIYATL